MEIINLDMTPSTVTPNAHAGQYDSARTVRFMLKNGGVPFTLAGTETITAEITRSDNTEVTVNVANTSSNYVDVVFDDTVCTVKGLYACELRLKDSDGFDIGSKNFALLVQRDPYDGKNVRIVTVGPADICTFETTLPEPYQSVLVNVEATGGNGTPDSPIPVNGYTEANITRCGVNLFGGEYDVIYPLFLPAGTVITASTAFTENAASIRYYDENKTAIDYLTINQTTPDGTRKYKTFTLTQDTYFFRFYANSVTQMQIELGSTPSVFHPYTGNTYTIAFGQTVYGGVLDVTRGKLRVTHGFKVFTGDASESWDKHGGIASWFFIDNAISDGFMDGTKNDFQTCNVGEQAKYDSVTSLTNGQFAYGSSNKRFVFKNTDYVDVADFKTWLSNNNMQVCYELATPFDIDLTPEVISAVVGTNNVFADCGETEVKYLKAGA